MSFFFFFLFQFCDVAKLAIVKPKIYGDKCGSFVGGGYLALFFFPPPSFEKCGCRSELGMCMTFENHGYEQKAPMPGARGFGAISYTHPTLTR